ncbi:hypothetical protein DSCW_43360 [Desulfosarcina widdelii]|uniref:Uncharacterized protein n=1 Tax=Desulfosarcina widdelii TaxID=947919 RepID=A0A5K7Z9U8_9BACT|nr:hypothetical protein [Desulfosarcina widdelii]BBO76919.1 hypothetical protein DSCW_43360 [Desulfosarcina widdelii]
MMEKARNTMIARCHLKESETVRQWIVPRCPWCGKRHVHGAGRIEDNPLDYLGHRTAHCHDGSFHDYVLVAID